MKKTFKKLTAVLLAVCLTLSVLSLTAVSAAETDSAAAGMDPILLEYTGTYTYDLTATADGLMCVSCYGDDEIYITDTEDNWINDYDDNLFVIFAVKAGQSYVIHLRSFDDDETHTCTISRLDVAPLRFQESEKIDLAAGCVRYFSFVPDKDMAYGFLGYNAKDFNFKYNFKISIFDDSFKTVFTESSCKENSFRVAAELTKGKTYYIFAGVKDEQPGSYDLVADNADALLPGIARSVYSSEGDGSITASFHAAEDADMLLRVSSSSYASAVLNVKDSKGETVVSRDYGDKEVRYDEISVKKGEDYSITFDYTGSNGYYYFYFELNRLDDIVSGKEFEAGNDNVIYRYVTTKDCVIKLTSSLDKYFDFDIYDSDFNYYTNNVIAQAGDRFYMLFTDEGKYTVSEMYEEIRVNETKDVEITSEFRLQPYIFKPEESGYYHYYSTDAEGAYCEIYAQDKSKENLIGGNRLGINKDFNVTFYANEGNVYYLFNRSSKEYDDYSVTIEKGAPVAIVDDVFMGDFNAKGEYKVPSHYNPPYDPANPDKYLDKDAEGAREVTEIAYWALAVNSDLVKVDIPDTVKKIGDLAFYYSSNLEEVRFSENLETIGNQAFANCRKLRSVTLPDSVTQMGPGVFRYSGVEEIKLSANLKAIPMEAFVGCSSLRSITIPASVESVGYYAFEYCRSLSKATVEDGVKELSDNAFVGCSSLKEITVPKSVTTIGKYAIGYSENGTYDENYNFNRDRYEDFVIKGWKGTEAERYANENGFRFVALDGAEPNPTEYGDANGDGKIDVTDATEIQKFAADMVKFNDAQLKFADANKDGKITVDDTTMVQKYAAGLIKSFDYPLTYMPKYMLGAMSYRPLGKLSQGYICFSTDDGRHELSTYTVPMFIQKNVPLTMCLWSTSQVMTDSAEKEQIIAAITNPATAKYTTGSNAGQVINSNYSHSKKFEVAQHGNDPWADGVLNAGRPDDGTVIHTPFDEKSLYDFWESENAAFAAQGIAVAKSAACPYGYTNQRMIAQVGGYFGVHRSVYNPNDDNIVYYPYYCTGERSNIFALRAANIKGYSLPTWKAAVDYAIAKHYVLCIYFHDWDLSTTGRNDGITDDGGGTSLSAAARLEALIDYAKQQGITFCNLSDIPHLT